MQKIKLDTGMQKFQINDNAVLEFNPSDIGVYSKLLDAAEQFKKIEEELVAKGKNISEADGEAVIRLMAEVDAEIKKVLRSIFGEQNDFDKIFGGVNVMAVATNGERVITNFMAAITPIVEEGAKSYVKAKAAAAAGQANLNRAQRK